MAATNKHGQTCEQTCGTMARSGFHSALCHTVEKLTTGDMAMNTELNSLLRELDSFDDKLLDASNEAGKAATAASKAEEQIDDMRETVSRLMDTVRETLEGGSDAEKEFRDNVRARVAKMQDDAQGIVNAATEALELIDNYSAD